MQRVQGGAERTTVQGFNTVLERVCCVVLCCAESIRYLFSVTCCGHDEALLCSHRVSACLCDLLHVIVNVSVRSLAWAEAV